MKIGGNSNFNVLNVISSLWTAHTVRRCRRSMPSLPLECTHGKMMSSVACHYCPSAEHTVRWRQALDEIIVLRLNTGSDDVRHGLLACSLGRTHDRMTLSVACHHRLRQHTRLDYIRRGLPSSFSKACTIIRRRRSMIQLPLDWIHNWTT